MLIGKRNFDTKKYIKKILRAAEKITFPQKVKTDKWTDIWN